MLKHVPKMISPDLLKILAEMGHGDELVIADGNFPSASLNSKVIRYDGNGVEDLLKSVLKLLPLDTYSDYQVGLMMVGDNDPQPPIWQSFEEILAESGEPHSIKYYERFQFYEQAKQAYAVIATGEEALYANIILKKGVV